MARTRRIKPGLFQNENLVELPFATRLFFAGLPCFADREGRLEDRPRKLKMLMFPADNLDIDEMLFELQRMEFITRYSVEGNDYIQIINFKKHQKIHPNEQDSVIPELTDDQGFTKEIPKNDRAILDLDLDLELVSPMVKSSETRKKPRVVGRFEDFWKEYPKKTGKKRCKEIWKRRKFDSKIATQTAQYCTFAEMIIADVVLRKKTHRPWLDGFVPNPQTYLNGDRWQDEIEAVQAPEDRNELPKSNDALVKWAKRRNIETRAGESWDDFRQRCSREVRA